MSARVDPPQGDSWPEPSPPWPEPSDGATQPLTQPPAGSFLPSNGRGQRTGRGGLGETGRPGAAGSCDLPAPVPRAWRPRAGEVIGGYRLVRRLGAGGMGSVWEARDPGGQRVAIKLLHPALAADARARRRLEREASVLARVHGPGVAAVLDVESGQRRGTSLTGGGSRDDEDLEALPFVVTELVDGPTLSAEIAEGGPYLLPEDAQALSDLAHGMAEALAQVHAAGVIHRDLKPSNVMLGPSGPVLIDFGISQLAGDARLTMTGQVTGTPGFIPPEVLSGGEPDEAGDWYALAGVLLFALTGRAPFGDGPWQVVFNRVYQGQVELGELPERCAGLARAFRAALAPDPRGRLGVPGLLAAIDDVVSGREPVLAPALARPGGLPPREPSDSAPPQPSPGYLPPQPSPGYLPPQPSPEGLAQDASATAERTVALDAPLTPGSPEGGDGLPNESWHEGSWQEDLAATTALEDATSVLSEAATDRVQAPTPVPADDLAFAGADSLDRTRVDASPSVTATWPDEALPAQASPAPVPPVPARPAPGDPYLARGAGGHMVPVRDAAPGAAGAGQEWQGASAWPGGALQAPWQAEPSGSPALVRCAATAVLALALVSPLSSAALSVGGAAVAGFVGRRRRALTRRWRSRGGPTASDGRWLAWRAPSHLLRTAASTLVATLLAGALTSLLLVAVGASGRDPLGVGGVLGRVLGDGGLARLGACAAGALYLLLLWRGPGGSVARAGARQLLARALPTRGWRVVVGVALLALTGLCLVAGLGAGVVPDTTPLGGVGWLAWLWSALGLEQTGLSPV